MNLEDVFARAAEFLEREQSKDGSFLSFSSRDSENFKESIPRHSIFSNTIIAQNLLLLPKNKRIKKITTRAVSFLLANKSKNWTWNYWARDAVEQKTMAYPDDLDDTSSALNALYIYNPKLITGNVLAHLVQVLTATEIQEGGPYRTWLVPQIEKNALWQDSDLVVNANIAFFLKQQKITLPNIAELCKNALVTKNISSPYYPKPLPILYFLSRVAQDKESQELLEKAVNAIVPTNALELALSFLILSTCQQHVKKPVKILKKILAQQGADGSWEAATFYTGVGPKGTHQYYAGSRALTTSFCMSALYISTMTQTEVQPPTKSRPITNLLHQKIITRVKKRFKESGPHLALVGDELLKQTLAKDKDNQITLLPTFFRHALGDSKKEIEDEVVIALGAASLYGWIAYTLYDNFLDNEGVSTTLPIANICLRELTLIFTSILPAKTQFMTLFQKVMDTIEEANTWEVTHCRIAPNTKLQDFNMPDYGNYHYLADRSLGHALGSIALCMKRGYSKDSALIKKLLQFYRHFLIARQLNDDAHDWENDLVKGQINSVGVLILTKIKKITPLKRLPRVIPLAYKKIFWQEVSEEVCQLIEVHVTSALRILNVLQPIQNKEVLRALVHKQQQVVDLTRSERAQALDFLSTYKKSWIRADSL